MCCNQVDTYEKIYDEVEKLHHTSMFEGWFRVDVRPFKQALLNIIKRWSFMFKQHLIDHVTNSLNDLAEFIKVSDVTSLMSLNDVTSRFGEGATLNVSFNECTCIKIRDVTSHDNVREVTSLNAE